ncbi:hypothetical protein ILUMI_08555 [Ignelater luminosus]|uniref:DDE-1 domain-containing protein n=1 Tax=Ignelater luminosus TaxID=2038154 RepID=A0A8K0D461_IGNLU|nr:hypothetical protein ILUMI_08555 [Ignelater luminosus]
MGHAPVLSIGEKNGLESWITGKAKIGFPMHPEEVKDTVQKVLEKIQKPNSFKNNRPGNKWLKGFHEMLQIPSQTNSLLDGVIQVGFYQWLIENEIKFPVLFLLDGHKSHLNPELAEFCVQKRILLYCLFPNATHILQRCDVGIFRPLKQVWRKEYQIYKQRSNRTLTKATFTPVFHKVFTNACKPEIIRNAFRCCGLYPFNVNNVGFSKCMNNRSREADLEIANISNKNTNSVRFLKILENELSPATLKRYKLAAKLEKDNQMKLALMQRKEQKKPVSIERKKLKKLASIHWKQQKRLISIQRKELKKSASMDWKE